jgi:hypothetical protein
MFLDGKSWSSCGGFVVNCGLLPNAFSVLRIFLFLRIFFWFAGFGTAEFGLKCSGGEG